MQPVNINTKVQRQGRYAVTTDHNMIEVIADDAYDAVQVYRDMMEHGEAAPLVPEKINVELIGVIHTRRK
jgi:uncharacterized membrane protein